MTSKGQSPPEPARVRNVKSIDTVLDGAAQLVFTRDHEIIRGWAADRHAEPATGEATSSGPATFKVNDGGAGIRFNFPGVSVFRPISWEEWLANFERHECAFVFDSYTSRPLSSRYRIVKAEDWKDFLS
jgi:hypothetical protein